MNNLLINAFKFSPVDQSINIEVFSRGDKVIVSVQDFGVGIPKAKQKEIFNHFYRAHTDSIHDVGGLGIGLYVVREIIHSLGGEVGVDSEEGKGSIFYFSLPLRSEA
jgi:two-component system CheB/CheR fusion protein